MKKPSFPSEKTSTNGGFSTSDSAEIPQPGVETVRPQGCCGAAQVLPAWAPINFYQCKNGDEMTQMNGYLWIFADFVDDMWWISCDLSCIFCQTWIQPPLQQALHEVTRGHLLATQNLCQHLATCMKILHMLNRDRMSCMVYHVYCTYVYI